MQASKLDYVENRRVVTLFYYLLNWQMRKTEIILHIFISKTGCYADIDDYQYLPTGIHREKIYLKKKQKQQTN